MSVGVLSGAPDTNGNTTGTTELCVLHSNEDGHTILLHLVFSL